MLFVVYGYSACFLSFFVVSTPWLVLFSYLNIPCRGLYSERTGLLLLLWINVVRMHVQARERQRREEEERLAREAAEAERKRKEEEEARERAAQEAAEKQAALANIRQEKALSLGEEPAKGPNVTQVQYPKI